MAVIRRIMKQAGRSAAILFMSAPGVLAAGCSPVDAAQESRATPGVEATVATPQRHPVSGLEIIEVTVMREGKPVVFRTEVASSAQDQARGLMFRTELADDEGMLFPSETPAPRSFWMKNTPIALDIIFIGTDGRISNIETAVPYSLESVPSDGAASAVFEIRGGLSDELGIEPGDKVVWELP